MNRPALLIAALALVGCEAGVSGTYELVRYDGQALPHTFEFWGDSLVLVSSSLTLRDSTYEWITTVLDADGEGEPSITSGTFTLDAANTVCLTRLATAPEPPPPPPPPPGPSGDTASSPATEPAARAPRQREPRTECIGKWVGDEITISDLPATGVFRR